MNGHILYYPTIEFQSDEWLKSALCIWDYVYRIVPPDYRPRDSDEVKEAKDIGSVREICLTDSDLSECADAFEKFWESVPMIPNGTQYVDSVRLFEDKVDKRLLPILRSIAQKFTENGPLYVPKQTADTYMLFLADSVARRRNMEKLTDDRDVFSLMHYFANDGNFTDYLCNPDAAEATIALTLPAVLPGGLQHVSMSRVLEFRDKHKENRIEFRESVSSFANSLTKVADETHARELIREFNERLKQNNTSIAERIKKEAFNVAMSMISVGVPAALTAMGTLISAGSYLKDSPTLVGSIAVGCVATIADSIRSRRSAWRSSDAFYYAKLHAAFGDGDLQMLIPKYDRILDEFIND